MQFQTSTGKGGTQIQGPTAQLWLSHRAPVRKGAIPAMPVPPHQALKKATFTRVFWDETDRIRAINVPRESHGGQTSR